MRQTAAIIAIALATVSCGASGSSESATPTTTPQSPATTTPVAEGEYASVQDMMKAVESTFYLCTAPMKIYDPPLDADALAQADCSSTVSFFIYEPDDVPAKVAEIQDNAEGTSVLLVGDNWIISCGSDEAVCTRVQGGAGGELMVSAP
ncbi:MAG: hypothetical protein PVJ28_02995 [Acidimicrobiia bacterium]|jgi:hypothetical protein